MYSPSSACWESDLTPQGASYYQASGSTIPMPFYACNGSQHIFLMKNIPASGADSMILLRMFKQTQLRLQKAEPDCQNTHQLHPPYPLQRPLPPVASTLYLAVGASSPRRMRICRVPPVSKPTHTVFDPIPTDTIDTGIGPYGQTISPRVPSSTAARPPSPATASITPGNRTSPAER